MWIARDSDGSLFVYTEKPHKNKLCWFIDNSYCLEVDNNLFPEVRWEDEEPRELTLK